MFIVRAEHEPRGRGRPEQLVERRLRARRPSASPAWRGSSGRSPPGCARSARASSRIASSASIRSSRVSPIPIRIPLVNGTRASPASRESSRAARAGSLSGEPKCGPPRSESRSDARLEHDPLRRGHLAQRAQRRRGVITPGFACGSRPVSSSTSRHMRDEVLERRLAAERGELLARRAVAQLRLVAEREERLAGSRPRRPRARPRAPRPRSCTRARRAAAARANVQ